MAVDALNNGAVDFLQKAGSSEKLVNAIIRAIKHSHQESKKHHAVTAYLSLTAREKGLLSLLVKGLKNQQIADALLVSLRTVEVHRANVMKKFRSKTIADLVLKYSFVSELGYIFVGKG